MSLKINEFVVDMLYPIQEMASSIIYSPLTHIKRFGFPLQVAQLFAPNYFLSISNREGLVQITPETIKTLPSEHLKGITPEKLERVLAKIKNVAKDLAITQEIALYTSTSEVEYPDLSLGSRISLTALPVFISTRTLSLSDEEVDFIIAHELSHISHNDVIKEVVFSLTVLTVELIAIFHFSILAIPLIEGVAILIENYLQRLVEGAADRSAITVLKSSDGASEYFNQSIVKNRAMREKIEKIFEKEPEKYFNSGNFFIKPMRKLFSYISKETLVTAYSSEGNYRVDLSHPPLTKRRDAAIAHNLE